MTHSTILSVPPTPRCTARKTPVATPCLNSHHDIVDEPRLTKNRGSENYNFVAVTVGRTEVLRAPDRNVFGLKTSRF